MMRPILKALGEEETQRVSLDGFALVARRLTVQGEVVGGIAIVMPLRSASSRPLPDINTIEPWLSSAVEAHLGQQPSDEEEEAFDRISSLHRLLHDAVDSGNQTDVATAFAEALFAWDGVEVTGYFTDVQGQWVRGMSPPGATGPVILGAEFGERFRRTQSTKVPSNDLVRFGFPPGREVVAIQISETTHDPWILLFAEGFRPINLPRLNLYADLLRDALTRLSNIVETRASWAILQALLGETGDPQRAVNAALRRVRSGAGGHLGVSARDQPDRHHASHGWRSRAGNACAPLRSRESAGFDNSSARARDDAVDGEARAGVELPSTRASSRRSCRGDFFSLAARRAEAARQSNGGASTRGFEAVLDRAASQMTRDGLDVSVVVIVVPESGSRRAVLQSWVTDIRGRLRGSDLAGVISDGEIGVLLSGTSGELRAGRVRAPW